MTFKEILATVVDGTPGAVGAAIMAGDGIPVEEHLAQAGELDLASVAVEYQQILDQASKVASAFHSDAGDALRELILVTQRHQLMFRQVDGEFFLVLALEPSGSLGKARYLVRSVLHELRDAL